MPEICQNVQKLDYQGAEGKSLFQIFKWGWAFFLINVNVGFQIVPWNDSKIRVDGNQKYGSNGAPKSSNLYKQRKT